jgi:DEP domain-containing protein 5
VEVGKPSRGPVRLHQPGDYIHRLDCGEDSEHLDCGEAGGFASTPRWPFYNCLQVSSAVVTPATKSIYRSLSAKVTIFIQVCKELWEFSGDGERYYEKIVHSFLPDLFDKWKKAGTNHTVHIVLISRVLYEESEIDYAAGPLRRDERGNWYKDFFKVITDLEVNHEWKPTLVALKNSFWDFQRDILLTHHYHRASVDNKIGVPAHVRLVGQLSAAQDGPILEALNLGLNPTETHYIDRSLSLTGATYILITPGTGYFRVSKPLLRLTTTRMLDQGVVLNLVLLTKQPLHQSPIFSFQGVEPSAKVDGDDPLMHDVLWCEDGSVDASKKKTFWWEPFWLSTTFWDKQKDLPFRQDRYVRLSLSFPSQLICARFVARAKMHEIQMLGLLEHDVLASIEVPFLPEKPDDPLSLRPREISKEDAEKYDNDIFADKSNKPVHSTSQTPSILAPGPAFTREKRPSQRSSLTVARIHTIEESPRHIIKELPDDHGPRSGSLTTPSNMRPGTSPSQSSINSMQSERSSASARLEKIKNSAGGFSNNQKSSLTAKLTPSWLLSHFRSGVSEPQTSQVVVSGTPATTTPPQLHITSSPAPPPPPVPAPAPTSSLNIPLAPHSVA